MRAQPNAPQNSPAALNPLPNPRANWRVSSVTALQAYRLQVRFNDGLEGEVDMSALVKGDGAGVFAALSDPDMFAQAGVEYGAVTWPGEIDLAPDAMYAAIKANGEWVLG